MAMKKKHKVKRRRRISIAQAVKVKEITVRYGGVIKTANYENCRVSFEMTADVPRFVSPDIATDYLETLCVNQFYQAQIREKENLPAEMQDEINISKLTPGEAAATIAKFFRDFGSGKVLTVEQKAQRIRNIDKELKGLAPKITAETKRLQKIKNVEGKDLETRGLLIAQRDALKRELKHLRR
ncbi:MAG: hypothetical protein PHH26_00590 [Candidatus Thermoplasmatota archaeon]|nr:hypothetical protein [Candidatus Thermoplasmatota archaeon]